MTLTIHLPDESARHLAALAMAAESTPERFATKLLERHLASVRFAAGQQVDETTFRAAMKATLEKNAELYRRLARADEGPPS